MKRTTVDFDKLNDAIRWLGDAKHGVDQTVGRLWEIPPKIGDAPTNTQDPNQGAANRANRSKAVTSGFAGGTSGSITTVGATHFGTVQNGQQVAAKHAGIYNSVLQGLATTASQLAQTADATRRIIDNYARTENVNGAGMTTFLNNPSSVPANSTASGDQGEGSYA